MSTVVPQARRATVELGKNNLEGHHSYHRTDMCQAALPQHWSDAAPTPAERARRRAALNRLAVVRDGSKVFDGPAVLDLIRTWDRSFDWTPGEDRGVLIHDRQGWLIETSGLLRRLLRP